MQKQSFLEGLSLEKLSPEHRGALIGGLIGAGGLGLTAATMSGKNKMRNAILAALAGGLGGAGLGYLHGGGNLFSKKPAPPKANDRVEINPATGKPPERPELQSAFLFKQLPGLGKPKAPQTAYVEKDPLKQFSDKEAPELPAVGGAGSMLAAPKLPGQTAPVA